MEHNARTTPAPHEIPVDEAMKFVEEARKISGNKTYIWPMCRQAYATRDAKEAARMINEGPWIIMQAAIIGGEIEWCLFKV